jgi:hypothetical protein
MPKRRESFKSPPAKPRPSPTQPRLGSASSASQLALSRRVPDRIGSRKVVVLFEVPSVPAAMRICRNAEQLMLISFAITRRSRARAPRYQAGANKLTKGPAATQR